MYARIKAIVIGVIAVVLLAVGATSATASRSFSVVGGGRALLAISTTRVTFAGDNGANWISSITLHGSIHPLVSKSRGALAGVITVVLEDGCISNIGVECDFTPLVGPGGWHLTLDSFTGTLPRITSVLYVMNRMQLGWTIAGGLRCLYIGDIGLEARATTEGGGSSTIERFTVGAPRNSAPLIRAEGEEFFRRCPGRITFITSFNLSPSVSIRLH